uniref:Uncharacterized protein n=1 Tax=Cacopsylla melanoneura TaxID=428564 RepID=A0A8D8XBI5_9HEMI
MQNQNVTLPINVACVGVPITIHSCIHRRLGPLQVWVPVHLVGATLLEGSINLHHRSRDYSQHQAHVWLIPNLVISLSNLNLPIKFCWEQQPLKFKMPLASGTPSNV